MSRGSEGRGKFDSGDALRLLLWSGERWSAVNEFCGKGVGRSVGWCFSEEGFFRMFFKLRIGCGK